MCDCSTNPKGYDALMLHIDFEGDETPWMYPLALNGRKLRRVVIGGEEYVPLGFDLQEIFEDGKRVAIEFDGERFEPVRECKLTHVSIPIPGREDASIDIYETACGERVFSDYGFCPYCGGKVIEEES